MLKKVCLVLLVWGSTSLYSSISWSPAVPLSELLSPAGEDSNIALVSADGTVVSAGAYQYFSAPVSTSNWTTLAPIPLGGNSPAFYNVYTAYNSSNNTLVAAWAGSPNNVIYSIYADDAWSTAALVPLGASGGANLDVNLVYDSSHHVVFAAWVDAYTHAPCYSIYNGTSWSAGAVIPNSGNGGKVDVSLGYDGNTSTVFAAWVDSSSGDPYYSTYDYMSGTWTTGAILSTTTAANNVSLAYDAANETMFAAWTGVLPSYPYYATYSSGTWTTDTISPITTVLAAQNVYMGYDNTTDLMFAAWVDPSTRAPYYASYNGSWSSVAPIALGSSSGVNGDVYLAANATQMVAAWGDLDTKEAYYSTLAGSTWTTTPIFGSAALEDVYLTYDSSTSSIFAIWAQNPGPAYPYYSLYDGSSWSPLTLIPLGSSTSILSNVCLAYDSDTSTVFASWTDGATQQPYYSTYNGSSWTTGTISLTPSNGAAVDVTLAYDGASQHMFAAWSDMTTHDPYYSVYSSGTWTTHSIPLGMSSGVYNNVFLGYDSGTGQMFAAWGDYTAPHPPWYSTYVYNNSSPWSMAADLLSPGASSGVILDVSLAFDPASQQMWAAWGDSQDYIPYASFYNGSVWTTNPISNSVSVQAGDISLAYNASIGQLVAALADGNTGNSYYSIYNNSAWTTGVISSGTGAYATVTLTYNSALTQMVSAWINYNASAIAYYSTSGTFSPSTSCRAFQRPSNRR